MIAAHQTRSFSGALRVARYSAPLYVAALVAIAAGMTIAAIGVVPAWLRILAGVGALTVIWFASASFLAFHWIFDRSELTRWAWLREVVEDVPARWLHLSGGLQETQAPIASVFPGTSGKNLDVYDAVAMPAAAITRARATDARTRAEPAPLDALPIENGWADCVFVVLAAHEIRDPARREALFDEVTRVLADAGRLILIEHPRSIAAALAFGPQGFYHFLPVEEWARLARRCGLELVHERRMSPFVVALAYRKAPPT